MRGRGAGWGIGLQIVVAKLSPGKVREEVGRRMRLGRDCLKEKGMWRGDIHCG